MSLAHNAAPTCRQCTALLPIGSPTCAMCGLQVGGADGPAAPHVSGAQHLPAQHLPTEHLPTQQLPTQHLRAQYLPAQYTPEPYIPGPLPGGAPYGGAHYSPPPYGPQPFGPPVGVVAAKSPGIAVLLTFLWLGGGHLYAGNIGLGVALMVFDVVLWFLAMTVVGLIIAVPLWLITFAVAAVLASNAVSAFNLRNGIVMR